MFITTSQVPGTSFRYRVPVFNKAVVPKPLFGKDKKVKTEVRRNSTSPIHAPTAAISFT